MSVRETEKQKEKRVGNATRTRRKRKHQTLFQRRNEEKMKKHLAEKPFLLNKKEANKRASD